MSLKILLQQFKSTEERDAFVNNYNIAYAKILEHEKMNNEFQDIFDLARGKPNDRKESDKSLNLRKSLYN